MKIKTRILNEQQIRALPLHNLKRYRNAVLAERRRVHQRLRDWDRLQPKATEDEIKAIKTLDWLAARCGEQYLMKKED